MRRCVPPRRWAERKSHLASRREKFGARPAAWAPSGFFTDREDDHGEEGEEDSEQEESEQEKGRSGAQEEKNIEGCAEESGEEGGEEGRAQAQGASQKGARSDARARRGTCSGAHTRSILAGAWKFGNWRRQRQLRAADAQLHFRLLFGMSAAVLTAAAFWRPTVCPPCRIASRRGAQ